MVGALPGEHLNGAAPIATGSRSGMIRLYGKLPAHGDFVSRGLREKAAQTADRMLTAMLGAAREAWGDQFADRYAAAQPWLWQGAGLSGLIIPSMDAAGRLFPLGLAAPTPDLQGVYDRTVDAIARATAVDALIGALAALGTAAPDATGGLATGATSAVASQGAWFLPDDEAPSLPHPDAMLWSELIASQGEVRV